MFVATCYLKSKRGASFPSWDMPLPPSFWVPLLHSPAGSQGHPSPGGFGGGREVEPGEAWRPSSFSPSSGFRSRLSPHTSLRTRVPTVLRHLCCFAFSIGVHVPVDSPLKMHVFIAAQRTKTHSYSTQLFHFSRLHKRLSLI